MRAFKRTRHFEMYFSGYKQNNVNTSADRAHPSNANFIKLPNSPTIFPGPICLFNYFMIPVLVHLSPSGDHQLGTSTHRRKLTTLHSHFLLLSL